jgi:biofilm PGA synthesis N-glycosyltransferase PgaC
MIVLGFLLVYFLLIGVFIVGYSRVKFFEFTSKETIQSFSIVIPFRNEAAHLPALLKSIRLLDYPVAQVEILMVNDASSDGSVQLIQTYIKKHQLTHIQVLENIRQSGSPKKDAIRTAIAISTHPWLITTDADCILPEKWFRVLDNYIQKEAPNMIAGPIALMEKTKAPSFLYAFETLDVHSMLGATISAFGLGHPIMANGAHLAYRTAVFHTVQGFEGNDHMASGDDLFLLEKFLTYNANAVHYLKNPLAIVRTSSLESWTGLVSQRKRWAAKASRFNSAFAKAVGIFVFLGNLSTLIIYSMLVYAILAENHNFNVPLLLTAVLLKYLLDGLLIMKALCFTESQRVFIWYPLVAPCYPIVTLTTAILAFTTSYTWKGRRFKQ